MIRKGQRVTEKHINSQMHVEHELIISVVRSRVEYFSILQFFDQLFILLH